MPCQSRPKPNWITPDMWGNLAQELTSTLDRTYQPLPQFDDFSVESTHGAPLSPNSPMTEEERPLSRKPRHRQSRGRGLRKTTGWYVSPAV
jgi:hypothetical protein